MDFYVRNMGRKDSWIVVVSKDGVNILNSVGVYKTAEDALEFVKEFIIVAGYMNDIDTDDLVLVRPPTGSIEQVIENEEVYVVH